ncbi:MAG: VPS10 domain-containing protein [Acidobacteriota bacterium]
MKTAHMLASAILAAGLSTTATAAQKAPTPRAVRPAAEASTPAPVRAEELRTLHWRPIGPANMGGRIADITGVPGDPATFYVALATGGLMKTINHGTTWTFVFENQPVASVGAVAVAPAKPDVVWVGTGEGNNRNSSSWGDGVYRSTDAGKSWTHLGLEATHNIPRLVVDPKDPDTAYVCALGHLWGDNPERGVFKTSDGGKTWRHALALDSRTGCVDLVMDPENPAILYAAAYARLRHPWGYESGGPLGGIYRTTDAGATWTRLKGGLPDQTGRIGLDVARSKPGVVYAVVESDEGGNVSPFDPASRAGGVFRSDDRGDSWTRVSRLAPRGFYFSRIRVDPKDERHLWVLAFDLHVSHDGGATWSRMGADKVHVDHHAMWIDPVNPKHALLGNDGGLYATWDAGDTWGFINNTAIGEFYNLAVDMKTPYTVCGGLQDNGTWCGPSATDFGTNVQEDDSAEAFGITNLDWRFLTGGDGFHVAIDPTNPAVVYSESQEGHLSRLDLATGVRKSLRPEAREGQPAYRFNWNTPFVISHHDPSVLYLGGNVLFRLTDRGDDWQAISPDLTTRDPVKMAAAGSGAENYCTIVTISESPKDAKVIWVGTDDGNLQLTRDGGATWTNLADRLPRDVRGLYVSRVEASHADPARVYVAIDGHRSDVFAPFLFVSDDFGRSFRPLAAGLPAGGPVQVIREDLVNPDLLFCGTEFGAFASFDRGRHWVPLRRGLPTVAVDDLLIHPRDRDLIAATHGRSILILDDITPLEQTTGEVLAEPAHLFQPRPAREFYDLPYGGIWGDGFFTAKNPPFGAGLNYWLKDSLPDEARLEIADSRGNIVRTLKGPAEAGYNRVIWDLQPDKDERIAGRGWGVQPQLVSAGTYTVTLKVKGQPDEKAALVVTAPAGVGKYPLAP